jgi:hypothetical protein
VTNDVEQLKLAVEKACEGCAVYHARSERVVETFGGEVVWDGMVEVFLLVGTPPAFIEPTPGASHRAMTFGTSLS